MDESTAVAARRNGSGHGIFEITNLVPNRKAIKVGGREIQGWVRGPGCRRSVDAEYRAALARYSRTMAEQSQGGGLNTSVLSAIVSLLPDLAQAADLALEDSAEGYERFLALAPVLQQAARAPAADDPIAWAEFLNEALVLVLPGLSLEEAELISDEDAFRVLRRLKWFAGSDEEQEADDATDPPAETTAQSETSAT